MAKVLIVEDTEEITALLKFKLKGAGYDVMVAENGEEGLRSARENPPDLVILDVMMPVMDGFEMLSILKKDEILKSVPVIVLTARSSEKDVLRGFELGADDYVTKPFRIEEFLARVKAVLSRCAKA
jgi:DNA-binding response OmpR family regulator